MSSINTILIKRRLESSPLNSIPILSGGELAFSEKNHTLYYGGQYGTLSIGGSGFFVSTTGNQTISGDKTFLGSTTLSSFNVQPNSVIDMGSNVISNIATPISDSDAVTKLYVDSNLSSGSTDLTTQLTALSSYSTIFRNVTSDVEVGAISATQVIPAYTTLQDFAEKLLFKVYTPTFTAPTVSMSNAGSPVEVGTSGITSTINLNRGSINGALVSGVWSAGTSQNFRSGAATKYIFNGVDNGTTNSYTSAVNVILGNNTINGIVEYAQGPQPLNSKNQNFSTPLVAGSLSTSTTVVGQYRAYFGTTAVASPTDTQIRTQSSTSYSTNALRNTRLVGTFSNVSFATRYWYIALPTIYDATPTVTINGLPNTAFTRTVITGFTNQFGVATDYAFYRGDNLLTGTYTFIIS